MKDALLAEDFLWQFSSRGILNSIVRLPCFSLVNPARARDFRCDGMAAGYSSNGSAMENPWPKVIPELLLSWQLLLCQL